MKKAIITLAITAFFIISIMIVVLMPTSANVFDNQDKSVQSKENINQRMHDSVQQIDNKSIAKF